MSCLYLSGGDTQIGRISHCATVVAPRSPWRLAARMRSFGLARLASSQLGRRTKSERERRARRYAHATAPASARTRASIPVGPVSHQAHFTLTSFLVVIVPCVDRGSTCDSRSTTDRIFVAVTSVEIAAKNRQTARDPSDERCDRAIEADNNELLSDQILVSATGDNTHVRWILLENWQRSKNRLPEFEKCVR